MNPEITVPAAIAIAAFIQGYGGFGFGITAMALVSLSGGSLEVSSSVVMIVATAMVLWLLRLSWHDGRIDWPNIGRLFAGALLGVPLGYWFLVTYGNLPLGRVVLGVVLAGFGTVGLLAGRTGIRMGTRWGPLMGIVSGFIGGAFVSGGPPVVIYLYAQADEPRTMKPTIQVIFLIMLLMRLVAAGTTGVLWKPAVLMLSAVSLPAAALLLALGHRLSKLTSTETFRLSVQGLIGVSGVLLIALNWGAWWESMA